MTAVAMPFLLAGCAAGFLGSWLGARWLLRAEMNRKVLVALRERDHQLRRAVRAEARLEARGG
jgi:thioester reductase-like protein